MTAIDIRQVAERVRICTREELLPRFTRVGHEIKADGSLLTEADMAMNQRLSDELRSSYPSIAFLSEEMAPDEQLAALNGDQPLWCLDPLDGTTNFAAGIPFFGVSLALLEQGRPEAAVIYDPSRDELFVAQQGKGATLNGTPLKATASVVSLARSVALIDLKRIDAKLGQRLIAAPPYLSQRNFGSCAIEWAWLAAGRGHVYLHGGQKLWDYAAGVLLLEEAGGHSVTLTGERVFKAILEPRSVVASAQDSLFRDWCAWLQIPHAEDNETRPRSDTGRASKPT